MQIRNILGVSFLGLALVVSAPVFAGKKDKAATATSSTEPMVGSIELTNVEALDGTIGKAKTIEDKMVGSYNNLTTARTNLNTALGVATDAPLATALADMKTAAGDKLKFAMDGAMPSLSLADGAPDNVKAGVEATKGLVTASTTAVKDMASLAGDIQALVEEAKALPGKVPTLGLDAKSLMSATKIVTKDAKAMLAFPDKAKAVTDAATAIINDVVAVFKG